ncbi:MAG TPA: class I SAM-dependent methyltransferase [Longimicrobiales bacterium]|nr:class I SAM-dependent methyltransferase [Longimicrobiales bacterium]
MRSNADVYAREELALWGRRSHDPLLPIERAFLERHLGEPPQRILEAGTGSGRIAFAVERMGFRDVDAFDAVPAMIDAARAAGAGSRVRFHVADAADLRVFPAESFDRAIYLQQLLSFVPAPLTERALAECHRVLRSDAIALFSFLDFRSRWVNRPLRLVVGGTRVLRGEAPAGRSLPWLKLGGRPNWRLLGREQPRLRWFTREEIVALLRRAGFEPLEIDDRNATRAIFVACRKTSAGAGDGRGDVGEGRP